MIGCTDYTCPCGEEPGSRDLGSAGTGAAVISKVSSASFIILQLSELFFKKNLRSWTTPFYSMTLRNRKRQKNSEIIQYSMLDLLMLQGGDSLLI